MKSKSPRRSSELAAARLATRLCFLVAGFGIACWAPLVPFAKVQLGVSDGSLGLLLLCIGIGSVSAMVVTGPLTARFGSKPTIVTGGFSLAALLPLLMLAQDTAALAVGLLAFGAALGLIDVAMNIHAVEVERVAGVPLMSGFHALFSIGGFAGAGLMTSLLSWQLEPAVASLTCGALMTVAMAVATPRLLRARQAVDAAFFAIPSGVVLLLAALAGATFLVEGAMLDWSALLMTRIDLVAERQGGLGYMFFAVAMTVGRLGGDAVTTRLGDQAVLLWGGIVALIGFTLVLLAPALAVVLAGFALIGLGASNIVPVLFRKAGAQTIMPAPFAIAAITTTGYAGILAGPAAVGFLAEAVGLKGAFWMLAALMCLVPATARMVGDQS